MPGAILLISVCRRCLTGVDFPSDESPELIAVDKQPDDQIVHAFRLGKTDGLAMSDNIGALAMGAVQHLDNHDATRSR